MRFDLDAVRRLRWDAVFISHFHDDHCSLDSLDVLDRATPIYLYCVFDELFAMLRALGFTAVERLHVDVPVRVGAIEVIPRRALDDDVDSLFQVRAAGLNVLNVVDSWIGPETLEQLAAFAPWDMVLWPFQTMREIAVIAPSLATRGPVSFPMTGCRSCARWRPVTSCPALASSCRKTGPGTTTRCSRLPTASLRRRSAPRCPARTSSASTRPRPCCSMRTALTPAAPLPWVIPVGPQDVDFDYRPDAPPPATADIARRFALPERRRSGAGARFLPARLA